MTEGKAKNNIILNGLRLTVCFALMLLLAVAFMLPACSSTDGAAAKVQEDLYLLQTTESAGNQLTGVRDLVSKESGKDIDLFLDNIRSFDYEIVSSVKRDDGDDH